MVGKNHIGSPETLSQRLARAMMEARQLRRDHEVLKRHVKELSELIDIVQPCHKEQELHGLHARAEAG
jgi:hypothetical protein